MKKSINFLSAAATIVLASAFAACSSDALVNEEAPVKEQQKVSLTVKATQGTRTPDTRLVYTPSDDNKTIDVKWSTGETLGVVSYEGDNADDNEYLTSTNTEAASSATFTGEVTASSNGKYNFYYPTSGNFLTKTANTVTMVVANQDDTSSYAGSTDLSGLSYYNLMYTEKAVDPSAGITLKHAFALLRLKLTLPAEAGDVYVAGISTWKPVFATSATVTYDAAGNATLTYGGQTSTLTVGFFDGGSGVSGGNTLTVYMLVPAVDDFTGQLCKVTAMDMYSNYYSYVYNLTADDEVAENNSLLAEKVYTFTATLKPDKWASSNVYWNGTNRTFDEGYTIGGAAYQGLFYKWGSLVGISPVGAWADNKTPLYNSDLGDTYTWGNIPYDAVTAEGGTLDTDHDICQQINSAYRIPTQQEWVDLYRLPEQTIGEAGSTTTDAQDGTGAIYIGTLYDNLVFIPYAGARYNTDGRVDMVGSMPTYWANEAIDAAEANNNTTYLDKTFAMPVRCIKKAASE
jgi:hypothetical protein